MYPIFLFIHPFFVIDDSTHSLFKSEAARGVCRVMCFHPKSNVTLPLMSIEEILEVINAWIKELADLGVKYKWVQVFTLYLSITIFTLSFLDILTIKCVF